jgi:hypothetical protein
VDSVADELTKEQLFEWWAYGYINGWFPTEEESKAMDPQAAQDFFQRMSNG